MALPSLWRSRRAGGELLPSHDILEPFGWLRRDLDRVFEDFWRDFGGGAATLPGTTMSPRLDISETDAELKIEAELPGIDEKDVEVRLDSGDLADLAIKARAMLDEAGLQNVAIFASGSLDEDAIAAIVARGAPITGFGVGTAMGVSQDAPGLDIAYKLCAYGGRGRLKLSTGKPVLPGRKQVFRVEEDGRAVRDVIARVEETLSGRPLLHPVMRGGRRLPEGTINLHAARRHAQEEIARLPEHIRAIRPAEQRYRVETSDRLRAYQAEVAREVAQADRDADAARPEQHAT